MLYVSHDNKNFVLYEKIEGKNVASGVSIFMACVSKTFQTNYLLLVAGNRVLTVADLEHCRVYFLWILTIIRIKNLILNKNIIKELTKSTSVLLNARESSCTLAHKQFSHK